MANCSIHQIANETSAFQIMSILIRLSSHFTKLAWSNSWSPTGIPRELASSPFLTLHPINTSYPFNQLAGIATLQFEDRMYVMDEKWLVAWSRLEIKLIHATVNLKDAMGIFTDCPFASWAFGYSHPSPWHQTLKLRVQLSRDWFQVWIALLSFLISCTRQDDDNPIPMWYSTLQAYNNHEESWLNGIYSSNALNFSDAIPRVEMFLNLDNQTLTPSIEWFVGHNIPVWYPLSTKRIDLAQKHPNDPMLRLIPPPELMHAWTKPNLIKVPSLNLSMTTASSLTIQSDTAASPASPPNSYISWQEFFFHSMLHVIRKF